jgi:hypothetical protein
LIRAYSMVKAHESWADTGVLTAERAELHVQAPKRAELQAEVGVLL